MEDMFDECLKIQKSGELTSSDVVLFEGGTDISPALYGESPGKYTQNPDVKRDSFEVAVWNEIQRVGAKAFGICRGAQLFTALSGGKLIQHVNSHGYGNHLIQTSDGEKIETSSVHHQMMAPLHTPHELLAWSDNNLSNCYLDETNKSNPGLLNSTLGLEPEAIWFPKTKALGVQGHPEFMNDGVPFQLYCRELIQKYLLT